MCVVDGVVIDDVHDVHAAAGVYVGCIVVVGVGGGGGGVVFVVIRGLLYYHL